MTGASTFRSSKHFKSSFVSVVLGVLIVVLLDKRSFLTCTNLAFGVLNYLDGTTPDRTLNPYAGTAAEEFTRPLRQQEIGSFMDIPVTFGQIPSAVCHPFSSVRSQLLHKFSCTRAFCCASAPTISIIRPSAFTHSRPTVCCTHSNSTPSATLCR